MFHVKQERKEKAMKEYENALRKIDEELDKVNEQIEIYAVKRDNEKLWSSKLAIEEEVNRLIGVYQGLYKAYCIVRELAKEVNKK